MSHHTRKDGVEQILRRFMPLVISELSEAAAYRDIDQLYGRAVALVVQTLLSQISDGEASGFSTRGVDGTSSLKEMVQEIGPLTPADVGEIYEYLRGFKVEDKSPERCGLAPSVAGKRNQGLFYTPNTIVSYIVTHTLDALDIREPSQYLDLKILDPAVGTGLFLAEALDQLTGRVLAAMQHGDEVVIVRVDNISKRLRGKAGNPSTGQIPDREAAVRIHILSNCLYGVDLDPVAVNIAQAALLVRAFGKGPFLPGFGPHVRVGNALMGDTTGEPSGSSRENRNQGHAETYFWKQPLDGVNIRAWSEEKRIFHWALEFPQVFDKGCGGFDAVIGNPPYEVLSAKESGIKERSREQAYVRRMFRTCKGKINTYRLMIERGLALLKKGGVLGFVVPATLLADSTADKLRRMILDETSVLQTVIVPEKARAFAGVAQAVLILIARKDGKTDKIESIFWDGRGSIPTRSRIEIPRSLIEQAGFRIPMIRDRQDMALLEALLRYPPLGGSKDCPPVGRVHQGEINLTVHREFITSQQTSYPLIRGEHIMPLRLDHPSPAGNRLDWILPEFFEWHAARKRNSQAALLANSESPSRRLRVTPWEQERIATGRVVNMDTDRRLKAIYMPPGAFLGDMTNFIVDLTVPIHYLLGLLNSKVLNRRIKLTSTNNYLSAAEIEALPIPRIADTVVPGSISQSSAKQFAGLVADPAESIAGWLERIDRLSGGSLINQDAVSILNLIELAVKAVQTDSSSSANASDHIADSWSLLDALVLKLYGVEVYVGIL